MKDLQEALHERSKSRTDFYGTVAWPIMDDLEKSCTVIHGPSPLDYKVSVNRYNDGMRISILQVDAAQARRASVEVSVETKSHRFFLRVKCFEEHFIKTIEAWNDTIRNLVLRELAQQLIHD